MTRQYPAAKILITFLTLEEADKTVEYLKNTGKETQIAKNPHPTPVRIELPPYGFFNTKVNLDRYYLFF